MGGAAGGRPVRQLRPYKGQRHLPGSWWSVTDATGGVHLWENGLNVALDPADAPLGLVLKGAIRTMRTMVFIPPGTEEETFTTAKLFAAIYPDAVNIAALIA